MADFMTSCKDIFARSAKMIVRTTKRITKAVKFKTHELSDLRKRSKLIRDLGELVYKLGSEGIVLPVDAAEIVKEITLLESDLNIIRADRAAQKAADAQLRAAEKAAHAAEKAAAKTAAAIEKSTAPVQADIPETAVPVVEPVDAEPDAPVLDIPVDPEETESKEIPTLNL